MTARRVVFLYHIPKTAGQSMRHTLVDLLGLDDGFVQVGPFGDKRSAASGIPSFGERSPAQLSRARVVAGHYLASAMNAKFPDADIESAIVLRTPAARLASHFNHAMFTRTAKCGLPLISFRQWYLDEMVPVFPWEKLAGRPLDPHGVRECLVSVGHNYMAKFVLHAHGDREYSGYDDTTLLSRATAILDRFQHVGAIESIGATQEYLTRTLGRPVDLAQRNSAKAKRQGIPALTADELTWIAEHNRVDRALYDRYCGGQGSAS